MSEDDRWVTIQEACELMNVSRRTIYNWLPKLVVRRTVGGPIRIRESSLWAKDSEDDLPASLG